MLAPSDVFLSLLAGVTVGRGPAVAVGSGVYDGNTAKGVMTDKGVFAGTGVAAGFGVLGLVPDSTASFGASGVSGGV